MIRGQLPVLESDPFLLTLSFVALVPLNAFFVSPFLVLRICKMNKIIDLQIICRIIFLIKKFSSVHGE